MTFQTDRKRAIGRGASHTGTAHHIHMIVTSVALIVLVPLFVFTFGTALGLPFEEARAYYARPWPALVAGLTFLVGFVHFAKGVQSTILDYVHGLPKKALLIGTTCVCYAAAALALLSIVRLAL